MVELVTRPQYEAQVAATRDQRMAWWREARFGMFVHFGIYATIGRNEWVMATENWSVADYEAQADKFQPAPGAPREWAKLAKASGMKYMVLTTRHHEGFSLWDSKVNPYNSVNLGPRRDIVAEFVAACREFDLGIGFYSSLMDWHHPDGGRAAFDSAARKRFTDYILGLNTELLTNYGKIDILWFDVPQPLEHAEGWNSLEMNQQLRALQPDIIINNRSRLDEDFSTPEERLGGGGSDQDWESCMTFNGLSWGYVDSEQAVPYSYNAPRILKMLATCVKGRGNLLLNIGPNPDGGGIPPEAVEPLSTVGRWLQANGEAVYGQVDPTPGGGVGNGISTLTRKGSTLYAWFWLWPSDGQLVFSGIHGDLKRVRIVASGKALDFRSEEFRYVVDTVSADDRDPIAGVTVVALDFADEPTYDTFATTLALPKRS